MKVAIVDPKTGNWTVTTRTTDELLSMIVALLMKGATIRRSINNEYDWCVEVASRIHREALYFKM